LLPPLGDDTSFDQLDLCGVEDGSELGDKGTVKRVDGPARAGRCAVEHAGKFVACLEDGVDACGRRVLFLVWADDVGEVGEVFGDEGAGYVPRTFVDGGAEGLSPPDGCYGGVSCKSRLECVRWRRRESRLA
jgi:hypothetical protein